MPIAEQVGAALETAVSAIVDSPVTLCGLPQKLTGGFWAQIWGVELTAAPPPFDQKMVLRIMPNLEAGLREAVVQRTVADSGFSTPQVLASGVASGLGEAYILMERIDGRTPLGGLRLGPEVLGLPKLLRRLPILLAETANALHAIDPDLMKTALDKAGVESRVSIHPFRARIDMAAIDCPSAGFNGLIQWLDDHVPIAGPNVICHGDLHPLNLLIDDHHTTWLLDWTTATIAPKEMDIGLTTGLLRCAPIATPQLLRPVVVRITNRLAESFITTVATSVAVDRVAVDWWEALQHGRCLADLVNGRLHAGGVVGPGHPFETAAVAMRRRLEQLTGVTITPPLRVSDQPDSKSHDK